MQVHKFGGASINSTERIRNMQSIVKSLNTDKTLIVVSAMGKSTNELEEIVSLSQAGKMKEAHVALNELRARHITFANELFGSHPERINEMTSLFIEVEKILTQDESMDYDTFYDSIVPYGELISSLMISHFLNVSGISNVWLDVRKVLKTNDHHREAGILWNISKPVIRHEIDQLFRKNSLIITQGFIGSTLEERSTTLGREGSDFTAAIFANILHGESVTIWKDVDGVMNADPKQMKDAEIIPHLNYKEVIEMAYYGAQVIHPKTIKPLQNESIPLYVKSFVHPKLPGTVINNHSPAQLPPVIVYKKHQVLLSFQTEDYSFIEGKPTRYLNEVFASARVKANISQNTAISLLICMDEHEEKREKIIREAGKFKVTVDRDLTLLTVRHYNDTILQKLTTGKQIILEQRTENTLQVLYKG